MRATDAPNTYIPRYKKLAILMRRRLPDVDRRLFNGHARYKDSDNLGSSDFYPGMDSIDFWMGFPPEMR